MSNVPQPSGGKRFDVASVIGAVRTPLSLLALVVLAIVMIWKLTSDAQQPPGSDAQQPPVFVYVALVALLASIVGIVWYAISRPQAVAGLLAQVKESSKPSSAGEPTAESKVVEARVEAIGNSVAFFVAYERKCLDYWFRELRPVLHQAAMYSTPTYYLDTKLDVIDWNLAFDLMFQSMTDKIRGKHVNWFIARLANHSQVFDHAKKFTEDYQRTGVFPFVDVEPLEYQSERYGKVRFTKVAAQLHNLDGQFKGWTIALLVDAIDDRAQFHEDLQDRVGAEKMWSVYSASYDRVLNRFPPYQALIQDVIEVVRPGKDQYVVDLGAGTGNVTAALLAAGHRVLAVENNSGMLDRFAQKMLHAPRVSVVKTSVEQLSCLSERMFDAAVMVNVLYAIDDPLACVRGVHRILKPGGVLGFSTTHRETDLEPLLNTIEAELRSQPDYDQLADDWSTVRKINRMLEKTIVRRHTRDDYLQWLKLTGFEVTEMTPSTYCDAVMVVHARRPKDAHAPATDKAKSNIESGIGVTA